MEKFGNTEDDKLIDVICPKNCMVFADKLYDTNKVKSILKSRGCHSGIIEKTIERIEIMI